MISVEISWLFNKGCSRNKDDSSGFFPVINNNPTKLSKISILNISTYGVLLNYTTDFDNETTIYNIFNNE